MRARDRGRADRCHPFPPSRTARRLALAAALLLAALAAPLLAEQRPAAGAADEIATPYQMVVLLDVAFPRLRGTCTGFLVGPRTVATAAHCVYSAEDGGWARAIAVTPGVHGVTAPFARQVSTVFAAAPEYIATGNPSFDYAAITLPTEVLGAAVGHFELSRESDQRLELGRFETAGYASNVTWGTQWRMARPRPLLGSDPSLLVYDWGTVRGGAPIFESTASGHRAVGIVTAGVTLRSGAVEVGVRADTRMLDFYRDAATRQAPQTDAPVHTAFTTARGRSVLVTSTGSAAREAPIVLQSSADRMRWTTIAAGTTDDAGVGAFAIVPTRTLYYRFVALGVGPGAVSEGVVSGVAESLSAEAPAGAGEVVTRPLEQNARGTFVTSPVFAAGRTAAATFNGGSFADLDAAIADAGGAAAWLQDSGGAWRLYVVGASLPRDAPANAAVLRAFPAGLPPALEVTVIAR